MQINVRLSGDLARTMGRPRVTVTVAEPAIVADLVAALVVAYPQEEPALTRAIVVVDGRHTGPNHPLESNRNVALLTPIAGGC